MCLPDFRNVIVGDDNIDFPEYTITTTSGEGGFIWDLDCTYYIFPVDIDFENMPDNSYNGFLTEC